jgi:hypothetical protein
MSMVEFWVVTLCGLEVKVKQSSTRHGDAWGDRRYSSYSFTTSALDGGEWSASRPGRTLPPGKGPLVPTVQEAGWAPEPVWTQRLEEKSSAPAGYRTPIARSSSPYSQTLYCLSYPGSSVDLKEGANILKNI